MLNLSGVFSLSGMVAFAAGVGVTMAYYTIKNRWLDRYRPNKDGAPHTHGHLQMLWIAWAAIILTIGFIGYQTQRTYNFTRDLAESTKACQNSFNEALTARSSTIDSNDAIAAIERQALHDWIVSLLSPPADIAALPPEDPRRQQWGIGVTLQYNQTVDGAEAQRVKNDAYRAAHPLPQPTCGK